MKLEILAEQINAYAAARVSGNPTLIQFSGEMLQRSLKSLPDVLPIRPEAQPENSQELK